MAQNFHVNGPAIIGVGGPGPQLGGQFVQLGYSEDGVEGTFDHQYEELKGDVGGPAQPQELQDMGMGASLRIRLLVWDTNVLKTIRAIEPGMAEGLTAMRGQLVFGNGNGFRVAIASALDEPWRFYYCVCTGSQGFKVGTRATRWDLNIRAISYIPPSATSAANFPWFDHIFG